MILTKQKQKQQQQQPQRQRQRQRPTTNDQRPTTNKQQTTTTTVNELMTCHVVFLEFSVLGQCSFCMFDGFRIPASCFPEEQRPFWDWMYNFWYLRWIVSLILL